MAATGKTPRMGRIRAFRCEDADAQVRRRLEALGVLFSQPQDLERALREARRAGREGAGYYDPARHAALARLRKARRHDDAAGTGRSS